MKKDYQKTYNAILQHDKDIREVIVPHLLDDEYIKKGYESGWHYGLGRDRSMRPILVISFRRLIDAKIGFDEMLALVDVLAIYTLENAKIPGKVETNNAIVDVKDVGLLELPVTSFVAWTQHLQRTNFIRGNKITFVNVHWLILKAVKVIYAFLDPFQIAKVQFFGEDGY